jgi:hypothetical protein
MISGHDATVPQVSKFVEIELLLQRWLADRRPAG